MSPRVNLIWLITTVVVLLGLRWWGAIVCLVVGVFIGYYWPRKGRRR